MDITHKNFMKLAIKQAKKSLKYNEVPVGAVITHNNQVISLGHNQVISLSDPTAHAEIIALRKASKKINNYRLTKCDIYVTLESCIMCLGAIIHSRIQCVYFSSPQLSHGSISQIKAYKILSFNHEIKFISGILRKETSLLLKNFFKLKRTT